MVQKIPDDKKRQYLTNHFKPLPGSLLHSHPVTKNGKTWNVSFQLRWLEQFPWLSYSRVVSGGICRYCILFPEKPGRGEGLGRYNRSGVLILSPYQGSYSKALGKDGILVCHNQTVMHCRAAERADIFLRNFLHASERIDSRLLKQSDQLADENRHILCQIIRAVEFLAKQGLPFRGHRDDKVDFSCEDTNRGNFVATLQLMAKGDAILSKHLCSAKKNAKYTSKTIQNQILHIYASRIRETITKPIREKALPYTIIADETTDHFLNQEILTLCLRFVDLSLPATPVIKECLLSFIHLQRANADGITKKILETLTHPSVSLDTTKICGQAYDGAAVMSSKRAGVQAKIKQVSPRALYIHCYSHCLNLSIAASCQVQEVRNLISIINEAHLFLSNSPKRQSMFELTVVKFMPASSHSKLPGLCKTRWVERHTCFEVFIELYEPLTTFLDAIVSPNAYPQLVSSDGAWNWDNETKVRAQGLKATLSSFQTISTFLITKNIFDEAKSLSAKLQKRDQDVYEALKMVTSIVENLSKIRSNIDVIFPLWHAEIQRLANEIGAIENVPRRTSLQRNRNNTPTSSPQEYYKLVIAIPLLDSLITQLKERFNCENNRQIQSLLSLVPSVLRTLDRELSADDFTLWSEDLPTPKSLAGELDRWKRFWDTADDQQEIPCNLVQALGSCDADSYRNIHYLLMVGCTLPITSAEAERTFSLLRKTYTRSTLAEDHFSDLAVMAMHYQQRIPVQEILEAFVRQHPRCIFQRSVLED